MSSSSSPLIRADAGTPLAAIDTGLSFSGDTVGVYFGPSGFRAPKDGRIVPGSETVPVSEGFAPYEVEQFQRAFEMIESYVDLRFETVTSAQDADFRLLLDTDQFTGNTLGYFYLPNGFEQYGVFNGAKWDRSPGGDLEIGGEGFATVVHELLHGLGLDHPHDGPISASGATGSEVMRGVESPFDDYGFADLNQGVYTMMTYNDGYNAGRVGTKASSSDWGYQAGPMALDIAVLQAMYGANATTNAGDTVYTLDKANDTGTHWLAIWDVGGTDTIRFDGGSRDAVIDLRPATLKYEQGGGGFVSAAAGIAGGFTIAAGAEIENAIGGGGDDRLTGNGGDNDLTGGAGNDMLRGGGGRDRALYDLDASELEVSGIDGGWKVSSALGTDRLYDVEAILAANGEFAPADLVAVETAPPIDGTAEADNLTGTAQAEVLRGFSGNDTLHGRGGDDTLDGGIGFDELMGGAGRDRIEGANGFDRLHGDAGNDTLLGSFGNDTLLGDDGDDYLNGGLGFDRIEGGEGDDRIDALDGFDTLIGGAGNDTLAGNAGNDRLLGGTGADILSGGIGADFQSGGAEADTLSGGNGADTLKGDAGRDVVNGNAGADLIDAGAGADRLYGGIGADTFVFGRGSGQDTIMDLGGVDRIALDIDLIAPGSTIASYRADVGGDIAFDFGGGDMLVLFGYDTVAGVAGLIEFV